MPRMPVEIDEERLKRIIRRALSEVDVVVEGIEDDTEDWQLDVAEIGQQLIDLKTTPVSSIDEAILQLSDCIQQLDDILNELEQREDY